MPDIPYVVEARLPAELISRLLDAFRALAVRIGPVPSLTRQNLANPVLVKQFYDICHSAQHRGLFADLPPNPRMGDLEYGVYRSMRILNRRSPDVEPIDLTKPTIKLPGAFIGASPRGTRLGDDSKRGTNLQAIDRLLVWFHLECRGRNTDFESFLAALIRLEQGIEKYFAGKWFDSTSDRRTEVRNLQQAARELRIKTRDAAIFEMWRPYSDGRIVFLYPDTRSQAYSWAHSNLPLALKPVAAVSKAAAAGPTNLSSFERALGGANDGYDTLASLGELGSAGLRTADTLLSVILKLV